MKKLLLGSLLAASTCVAMIAPATAATNNVSYVDNTIETYL